MPYLFKIKRRFCAKTKPRCAMYNAPVSIQILIFMNNRILLDDFTSAFKKHYLWRTLAWYDILARYRRSVLGPFWLTISMAVTIAAMGPLYGSLFSVNLAHFIPHLSLGMIFWAFIAASVNDSANTFSESAHFMKQIYIPAPIFVLRVMYRQLLILGHNLLIYPVIALLLSLPMNRNILLFFPALMLVTLNLILISLLISILCARFRDMSPILSSIMSLLFFVTPIIWQLEQLPERRKIFVAWNLFACFLDLLRKPILGGIPAAHEWIIASISAVILFFVALHVYQRTHHRITYWL